MKTVRLEALLGRAVADARGRKVGRIRTVTGVRDGPHCFVTAYHLGTLGLLSRLGIVTESLVGVQLRRSSKRVPWQMMDLSDPDHPRLTVALEDLPAE